MRGKSYLALLLIVFLWGMYYIGTEKLLESGWDPEWMNALRFLGGAFLFLLLSISIEGRGEIVQLQKKRYAQIIVISWLFMFVGMWVLTESQRLLPSSMVGSLSATIPLWTALLAGAAFFGGRRLSSTGWLGMLLGALGVLLIYSPWNALDSGFGVLLVLLASLFLAGEGLFVYKWMLGAAPLALTSLLSFWAGLAFLIAALPGSFQTGSWLLLLLMTLGSNGVAYLAYFWLVLNRGATFASLYNYIIPPFAILVGTLLGGDSISAGLLIGCAAAVLGALLASSAQE